MSSAGGPLSAMPRPGRLARRGSPIAPATSRFAIALGLALGVAVASPRIAVPSGSPTLAPGVVHPSVPTAYPGQTYALYLPRAYDPRRPWPLLLLYDPARRGAFAAEIYRQAAEERGWIVVSSNNGESDVEDAPDPFPAAMRATWDEAHARFAIDPHRIYVAGFSGSARASWRLAGLRPVAGIVCVGAGLPDGAGAGDAPRVAAFLAAGEEDFNLVEARALDRALAGRGFDTRFEPFAGGHAWLPSRLAVEALRWFDLLAMRDGRLPRDPSFETASRSRAIDALQEIERAGDLLAAWRTGRRMERDFRGLGGAPEVAARLARLESDPRLDEARQRELEEERREADFIAHATATLARAFADPAAVTVPQVARELGIASLQRRAASASPDAGAARRLLATLYVQTSFYLPRRMVTTRRLEAAELALLVALEVEPEGRRAWYGLAAVRARGGRNRTALDALERAVGAGFDDPETLANDEAFAGLRNEARFVALLARLRASARPAGRAGGAPVASETGTISTTAGAGKGRVW